jgi:hypothetical protein
MQTYGKFQPTAFDPRGLALDDQQHWLVLPVGQNRDSGPLDQSNFAQALEALGGESEDVEVHNFGHWACGWFEIIIVNPSNLKLVAIAEDIERALMDYPVLNDEDLSQREWEDFCESWDSYGAKQVADDAARNLGFGTTLRDFLRCDADRDDFRQFFMDHSNEPYFSDSGGVNVGRLDCSRDDLARFILQQRAKQLA